MEDREDGIKDWRAFEGDTSRITARDVRAWPNAYLATAIEQIAANERRTYTREQRRVLLAEAARRLRKRQNDTGFTKAE